MKLLKVITFRYILNHIHDFYSLATLLFNTLSYYLELSVRLFMKINLDDLQFKGLTTELLKFIVKKM